MGGGGGEGASSMIVMSTAEIRVGADGNFGPSVVRH